MASRQTRRFLNRALNFVRPKPRLMPLAVDDVLANSRARDVVEQFNDLFYMSDAAATVNWRGVQLLKNPCDLWTFIDLIQRLRPRVVLETGTHHGGSATFFRDMLDLFGVGGEVITIDINPKWDFDPAKRNIRSLVGYSTEERIAAEARGLVEQALATSPGHVLLTLDSDHSAANVLEELRLYSPLVTVGSYAVVEDGNINGHPSAPSAGPGPYEAAAEFLTSHPEFVVDEDCQRFMLTFNPRGWLRRVS